MDKDNSIFSDIVRDFGSDQDKVVSEGIMDSIKTGVKNVAGAVANAAGYQLNQITPEQKQAIHASIGKGFMSGLSDLAKRQFLPAADVQGLAETLAQYTTEYLIKNRLVRFDRVTPQANPPDAASPAATPKTPPAGTSRPASKNTPSGAPKPPVASNATRTATTHTVPRAVPKGTPGKAKIITNPPAGANAGKGKKT